MPWNGDFWRANSDRHVVTSGNGGLDASCCINCNVTKQKKNVSSSFFFPTTLTLYRFFLAVSLSRVTEILYSCMYVCNSKKGVMYAVLGKENRGL